MRVVHPVWTFEELLAYFAPLAGEDVLETDLLGRFFPAEGFEIDLDLFERHFLLYRRLWLFDDELRLSSGRRLWIRGIRSTLLAAPEASRCDWLDPETGRFCSAQRPCRAHSGDLAELHTMKSYYLDWNQLESMTASRLQTLVDGFFRWSFEPEAVEAAYRVLGLEPGASGEAVTRAWRHQSKKNHPDRGGDVVAFQKLSAAYAKLRQGPR